MNELEVEKLKHEFIQKALEHYQLSFEELKKEFEKIETKESGKVEKNIQMTGNILVSIVIILLVLKIILLVLKLIIVFIKGE